MRRWRNGLWRFGKVRCQYRGSDSGSHSRLGSGQRQGRGFRHSAQIWVYNNLPVVAQIYRLEFVELLPPLPEMGDIHLVAVEVIR